MSCICLWSVGWLIGCLMISPSSSLLGWGWLSAIKLLKPIMNHFSFISFIWFSIIKRLPLCVFVFCALPPRNMEVGNEFPQDLFPFRLLSWKAQLWPRNLRNLQRSEEHPCEARISKSWESFFFWTSPKFIGFLKTGEINWQKPKGTIF